MKPPIADPFAPPSNSTDSRVFRVNLFRSFPGYFALYLLLLIPIVLPVLRPDSINSHLIFCGIVVFVAVVSTLTGLFYSVEVSARGLTGSNAWGAKHHVEWHNIQRVRYCWCLFSYALISTVHKRNIIWLPLYLNDKKGFAQTVEEWAPADNPLRLWLQKRGF